MSTLAVLDMAAVSLLGGRDGKPRLCPTGSVTGSIRGSAPGQVALTSGPLALDHRNDSPHRWKPVEIISLGPVSAPKAALAITCSGWRAGGTLWMWPVGSQGRIQPGYRVSSKTMRTVYGGDQSTVALDRYVHHQFGGWFLKINYLSFLDWLDKTNDFNMLQ